MARLVFGAAALATGCSDATNPQAQLPGTYSLRSVDSKPLPFTVMAVDVSFAITSDVYTFAGDGTFAETTSGNSSRAPGPTTPYTSSNTGTWTLRGSTLTLTFSDATTRTGTYSGGNTITASVLGYSVVALYEK